MTRPLDTVLLLALPASGKSEVRRYIDLLDAEKRARDLRMGPTVQLDDYPYVHMMRVVDDALAALGAPRYYFQAADRPFADARHWGTLIELLNEDYADLIAGNRAIPSRPGSHLLARMDAAARKVGAAPLGEKIGANLRDPLAEAINAEATQAAREKAANIPESLDDKTLVIEFARGGAEGAPMPLAEPFGYRYALSRLAPGILEKATVLYIWVEPEESKRKNRARMKPDEQGSILHHGVPEIVMQVDYGCDDIAWMLETSPVKGTISIQNNGRSYQIPTCRFDNRVDKTSFLREDPKLWNPGDVAAVHEGLRSAIASLP